MENMRVIEIVAQDRKIRYVVIDEEGKLVGPIVHYLKYLDGIGLAHQTLHSYAAGPHRNKWWVGISRIFRKTKVILTRFRGSSPFLVLSIRKSFEELHASLKRIVFHIRDTRVVFWLECLSQK